jgi:hypothetical protein
MRDKRVSLSEAPGPVVGVRVARGRITGLSGDLGILVEHDREQTSVVCDVLITAAEQPALSVGDTVLFVRGRGQERGCVLGVVRKYQATPAPPPEHVILKARERIELRVGQSSVVLSKDGRVTVKGEEVVSRAMGVNKIRGAAVKIN